jgi:pimeloyl-ACP methyl ester carboxylesterase
MADPTIILVHGLWMTGVEMILLKRRLQAAGFNVLQFRYRMVRRSLDHNTERLRQLILAQDCESVHLVGHSLGGVLSLQTLRKFPDLPVGKVVCLGSPLVDTVAGRRLVKFGVGRRMLGQTLPEAIFAQPLKEWAGAQSVGVLAGDRGVGIGQIMGRLPRPHDGVVTLAETCLPGISDHLVISGSHAGLVISRLAAEQCVWFLRHGQFRR